MSSPDLTPALSRSLLHTACTRRQAASSPAARGRACRAVHFEVSCTLFCFSPAARLTSLLCYHSHLLFAKQFSEHFRLTVGQLSWNSGMPDWDRSFQRTDTACADRQPTLPDIAAAGNLPGARGNVACDHKHAPLPAVDVCLSITREQACQSPTHPSTPAGQTKAQAAETLKTHTHSLPKGMPQTAVVHAPSVHSCQLQLCTEGNTSARCR